MINSAKIWSQTNNFENWRLVLISSASVIADDTGSRQYAFDRWKAIIPDQVNTDGSMIRELGRTNSLTYSTYAVSAMVQTAEIARHYGVDLYNYKLPDGRGLENVLDFHVPYIIDPSTWPYKQTNPYKGDNAAVYELAYSFKQKSSYSDVINKWKRPMYEMRVIGPITLTHANANFNVAKNVTNTSTSSTNEDSTNENITNENITNENITNENMTNGNTTDLSGLFTRLYKRLIYIVKEIVTLVTNIYI